MTNAEANAARPTEQAPRSEQQSNFSQDTVHNLYSSISDLAKSEQNKQTPDWLPSSKTLLPSDSAQRNPNSNLADFLQSSQLSGDGGKDKIPYGLAGESKSKPGSAADDPHSGNPETINPNSANSVSGAVEKGKQSNMPLNRENSHESINDNPPSWSRNTINDEGIPHPKGDVAGPGSKEPSGEKAPEHLRNRTGDAGISHPSGDVPGPGSKAPGANRDASAADYTKTAADSQRFINPDDVSGPADKIKDKSPDSPEQKHSENSRKAADILSNRGDLGNEYQRSQIKEMYRQTLEQGGPGAVADLTRAINKELERRGSDVRVNSDIDLPRFPLFGGTDGMGVRLDVLKGSQKVDEMRIIPLTRWDAYPHGRERLSR